MQREGVQRILDLSIKSHHKREDLEKLVRGGTVVALVHTFLLAEPKSKNKAGGRRKDLLDAMSRIEKRGGTIKDVDSGLTTANNEHRYALIALATEQLAPLRPKRMETLPAAALAINRGTVNGETRETPRSERM